MLSEDSMAGADRLGASLWPWPLVAAVTTFLGLVPGTTLLHAAMSTEVPGLVATLTLTALTATGLAIWSARSRDRVATGTGPAPPAAVPTGWWHAPVPRTGRDHDLTDTHHTRKHLR